MFLCRGARISQGNEKKFSRNHTCLMSCLAVVGIMRMYGGEPNVGGMGCN